MTGSEPVRKVAEVFAESVRVARARRQWSQAEVAQRAGLSAPVVSEVERAVVDPQLSTVERIADALGLSVRFTEDAA